MQREIADCFEVWGIERYEREMKELTECEL